MSSVPEELIKALASVPELKLAVLFGSLARGRAKAGSDLDLAVSLSPDTQEARRATRRALHSAAARTVDLVFAADAPPLLRMEIARHGVPLLERQLHAWANFKAKAMIDWGDWAPYARRLGEAAVQRLRQEMTRGPT